MNLTKFALIGLILTTIPCHGADYTAAASTAMNAAYKQAGYDTYVNAYANDMAAKYVPLSVKDPAAVGFFIYKLVSDHSIGFTWRFP
jgi:hypothetical protein